MFVLICVEHHASRRSTYGGHILWSPMNLLRKQLCQCARPPSQFSNKSEQSYFFMHLYLCSFVFFFFCRIFLSQLASHSKLDGVIFYGKYTFCFNVLKQTISFKCCDCYSKMLIRVRTIMKPLETSYLLLAAHAFSELSDDIIHFYSVFQLT